jgi:uncharacterized protein (UPF0264 family)
MRLLVSVRSPEEARSALLGGADIIDAKEPSRGSLGAVAPELLAGIALQVPQEVELSVALGDFTGAERVTQAITRLPALRRRSAVYVKLGLAGVSSEEEAGSILEAGLAAARQHPERPRVVAVAYADSDRAESAPPEILSSVAARSGAAGLLIDTHVKDGRNLLDWMAPDRLSALIALARRAGLLTALAGSLKVDALPILARAAPDIVGFRAAACAGGREGRVSRIRVARLRRGVQRLDSGFLQAGVSPLCHNRVARNARRPRESLSADHS